MLLRVGYLKHWVSREWAKGFSSKGILALVEVAKKFIFKKSFDRPTNLATLDTEANATEEAGTVVQTPNGDIFFRFFEDDHENAAHEAEMYEIKNFTKLVFTKEFLFTVSIFIRNGFCSHINNEFICFYCDVFSICGLI
jgi:hypothetical protein